MGIPKATRYQNAVRLLAIIVAASDDVSETETGKDVVGVLHSQLKLQALDFWMRSPDYLANELVNEFERTGDLDFLVTAKQILDSREPDLRSFPMIRFFFGAFEPLDDALALLKVHDLIRIERVGEPGRIKEHVYLLTLAGKKAMTKLAEMAPELNWYAERARLVAQIAGNTGGKALKDRQYLQNEYSTTALGGTIPAITGKVIDRLNTHKDLLG